MQGRQHHLADFTGRTRFSRFVENLDDQALGLDVVVLVLRALERDVAHLLGRIDVGERHAPGAADDLAGILRESAAERPRLAQAGEPDIALEAAPGEPVEVIGVGQQIVGRVALQPVELLVEVGGGSVGEPQLG